MATLTVDDKTAREIYPTAAPALKAILEDSYPKDFFKGKITDRIKTFEDACEYNNTNPNASKFIVGTRQQRHQERVAEITKALNEGWVPNYDDGEYKYTPWFYLDKPGFRFDDSGFTFTLSAAGGGSRFAFKTRELSDYAGRQFLQEYKNWMMLDQVIDGCMTKTASISRRMFDGDVKAWEAYIIPRIKIFEDACAETGNNPMDYRFQQGTPDEIAYRKYKVVCEALNGGWKPDWKNRNQAKWYPWLEYDEATAGFRFDVSLYTYSFSYSGGGSRLRLCSSEIAKHAGTQFLELLNLLLL
jgi:hypothetical protein